MINSPMGPGDEIIVPGNERTGYRRTQRVLNKCSYVHSYTNIKSPMGPRDEMIVPEDLECSCNIYSFIWYVERKTSRSICDICGDSDSESECESGGLG